MPLSEPVAIELRERPPARTATARDGLPARDRPPR